MKNKHLTISQKINIITIGLMIFLSTGTGIFISRYQAVKDLERLTETGEMIADMVSENIQYALYTENRKELSRTIQGLSSLRDIAYISIADSQFRELTGRAFISDAAVPKISREDATRISSLKVSELKNKGNNEQYLNILTPVISTPDVELSDLFPGEAPPPEIIGYVQLGMSQEILRSNIRKMEAAIFAYTFVLIFIGILIMIVLTKRITHPLKQLSVAARGIAKGKMDYEIKAVTGDETADLGRAFKVMIESLREYREQIEKRTNDLEKTNENLHDEILERKRIQRSLLESEEKYRLVVENANEAIVVVHNGLLRLFNNKFNEVTGFSNIELSTKPFREFIHPDDRETVSDLENRTLNGEKLEKDIFTVRIIRKDGSVRWIEIKCAKTTFKNEPAIVHFFSDISDRRKIEEELHKAQKLESLGILAGGIAHDFNNLLTGIVGNISIMKANFAEGSMMHKSISEIERASSLAKGLTRQLLTFSKGGEPIKKAAMPDSYLINTSVFALSGSNVQLDLSVPDDIWPVEIDEGQISQAIGNILINAKQAMPLGGIVSVRAENIHLGPGNNLPLRAGKYVKIEITDKGTGIDNKTITKIFDPFFTTKEGGSGLGLATAYSILKKHDGYISVQSEPGHGSTFTIYLPAFAKEPVQPKTTQQRHAPGTGRILLMDDDELLQEIATKMLEMLGYESSVARHGEEAIEMYKKAIEENAPFDAVILDLTVPGGMGGSETIKHLQKIDPDVKAIVSSGYFDDPVMAQYLDYGFIDFLEKPYSISGLGEVLKRAIDQ